LGKRHRGKKARGKEAHTKARRRKGLRATCKLCAPAKDLRNGDRAWAQKGPPIFSEMYARNMRMGEETDP